MNIGYILCLLTFVHSNFIGYKVEANYAITKVAGRSAKKVKNDIIKREGYMKGLLTVFQLIVLSLGEAFLSSTAVMFSYTQVGPQMRSLSTSIWLLTHSIGNEIVSGLTFAMKGMSTTAKMWVFIAIGVLF
ncbi:hypothetical protein CONCODRAFT_8698 [Conidiobolus coronatus NRRL 28638]|uniref:Uncharacterized protein n=1 Tax=Conidiobolus coronatus (strain ATCC 28846 / CBS 209.66 / NRRL 28638) TaxID=796925 RepID=A0A137P1N7_CONC2|nr:hypothetical protein CONCODRAFT_8698 [Conidiobolus coronatus NRRL 28638]|eukprot:KXN68947.1 hypothetical protein CONCODRAFT_8698 [Conidiobolus coronatus NRRL 28638]